MKDSLGFFHFALLLTLFADFVVVQEISCPKTEEIFPCTCDVHGSDMEVKCGGQNVSQETLNALFYQLRAVNNLTANQTLELHVLQIHSSPMTQLDLTPFYNSKVRSLSIFALTKLTSIVGPLSQTRSIKVQILSISNCPLTDEGFGDSLNHFDTSTLENLYLNDLAIIGGSYLVSDGSGDLEFLPGLSAFTNLLWMSLGEPQYPATSQLIGGQFRRNTRLGILQLYGELFFGDDAFSMDESLPEILNKPILIEVRYNRYLTNSHFGVSTTLAKSSRPIQLDFSYSIVESLDERNFKAFLEGHPNNTIGLSWASLDCDERMKWLKDNSELYKPQVLYSECGDGKSIFETSLIS